MMPCVPGAKNAPLSRLRPSVAPRRLRRLTGGLPLRVGGARESRSQPPPTTRSIFPGEHLFNNELRLRLKPVSPDDGLSDREYLVCRLRPALSRKETDVVRVSINPRRLHFQREQVTSRRDRDRDTGLVEYDFRFRVGPGQQPLHGVVQPIIRQPFVSGRYPSGRLVHHRLRLEDAVHVAGQPARVEREGHRSATNDEQLRPYPTSSQVSAQLLKESDDLLPAEQWADVFVQTDSRDPSSTRSPLIRKSVGVWDMEYAKKRSSLGCQNVSRTRFFRHVHAGAVLPLAVQR